MIKKINRYQRLLYWLEMKITGSTVYKSEPITFREFAYRIYRYFIYPFKKRGWFGYCSNCEHFVLHLEKEVIDVDYDNDDEEIGTVVIPIYGMVCLPCSYQLGVFREI